MSENIDFDNPDTHVMMMYFQGRDADIRRGEGEWNQWVPASNIRIAIVYAHNINVQSQKLCRVRAKLRYTIDSYIQDNYYDNLFTCDESDTFYTWLGDAFDTSLGRIESGDEDEDEGDECFTLRIEDAPQHLSYHMQEFVDGVWANA
jgi:hypothetical protein